MKKFLLLFLFVSSSLIAQPITWTEVTSTYSLPSGVKVYKGVRSSPALTAYYFDVDLNNPKIAIRPYVTGSLATLPVLVKRFGAYAAVNGGFFSGTSSVSTVVYPSEVKAQNIAALSRNSQTYPVMRSFFGIKSDRSMAVDWIYHFGGTIQDIYKYTAPIAYSNNDPSPKAAPQKSSGSQYSNLLVGIGGGPTLVKNSQAKLTYNEEIFWGSGVELTDLRPRTAVGYTANKHAIIFACDQLQLQELPDIFISLGCVEAMNLDGGGSTQMSVGDQSLISSSRDLPAILAVVNADSLNLPKTPVFQKIIDTGDKDAEIIGNNWSTSANSGYYGSTPSRICGIGDGSSIAQFRPNLTVQAEYEVYAWWVASDNRAKDTPFIIRHKNGTDTLRMNQSVNGSVWNLVGKYTFNADTTDRIIITNGAKNGSYVVADAVRIVSYDPATATGVSERPDAAIIKDYSLSQNYPNPFNPSTMISYSLAKESLVTVKIYDVLGNEVSEPVNDVKPAGNYQLTFQASSLPSGVYFCRMHAGGFSDTKKMIYLK